MVLKVVVGSFGTRKEWNNHRVKGLFCYFYISCPIPRGNKTKPPTPDMNKIW